MTIKYETSASSLVQSRLHNRLKYLDLEGTAEVLHRASHCNGSIKRRSPDTLRCGCPGHDDKEPSLDVTRKEDGTLLLKCWAGCENKATLLPIMRSLGIALSPIGSLGEARTGSGRKMRRSSRNPPPGRIVRPIPSEAARPKKLFGKRPGRSLFVYRNAQGEPEFLVRREDKPDGAKVCLPFTLWDVNGKPEWHSRAMPTSHTGRVLYNLPDLLRDQSQPIVIVEGEKAAESAISNGLLGDVAITCWAGGSSGIDVADYGPLKKRDVIIWMDNDETGRRYADKLVKLLDEVGAKSVSVVQVPSDWRNAKGKGWDLADPLPKGVTEATLREMVATALNQSKRPSVRRISPASDDGERQELMYPAAVEFIERAGSCPPDEVARLGQNMIRSATPQFDWPVASTSNNNSGLPVSSAPSNIDHFIDRLCIRFRRDEFAHEDEVVWPDGQTTPLSDDIINTLYLKAHQLGLRCQDKLLWTAVKDLAAANYHHPVRDYLGSLKWDGEERLSKWLISYAGADDNQANRIIGEHILIAAVQRIYEPGCEMQWVPILEGNQGVGKSKLLRIMCGDKWFSDSLPIGVDDKLTIERSVGMMFIEWAEMDGVTTKEATKVKAWISQRHDVARLSYARKAVRVPRQFVVVGTINPAAGGYMRDTTGNRRYAPVAVGETHNDFDLVGLERDRHQLWAEAVAAYRSGNSGKLPQDVWREIAERNAERTKSDPWEELILKYLRNDNGEIRVCRVPRDDLWNAVQLGNDMSKWSSRDQARIEAVMTRNGFRSDRMNAPRNGKTRAKIPIFTNAPVGARDVPLVRIEMPISIDWVGSGAGHLRIA